jgi:hypothetical protein
MIRIEGRIVSALSIPLDYCLLPSPLLERF